MLTHQSQKIMKHVSHKITYPCTNTTKGNYFLKGGDLIFKIPLSFIKINSQMTVLYSFNLNNNTSIFAYLIIK